MQARPITALPEPTGPTPTDWTVPDPRAFYARASIVEQLPDPLTPLFADLVDGSVTRSLQALFGELLGRDVVRAGDVGLPTINGYAYYRYARGAMARMMLESPGADRAAAPAGRARRPGALAQPLAPALRRGGASGGGRRRWPSCPTRAAAGRRGGAAGRGHRVLHAVQTIIPLAATSEVAFTRFYDRAVRRAGDPPAATFLLGFDSLPIRAEKSLYELAGWTREHPELAAAAGRRRRPSWPGCCTTPSRCPMWTPRLWREWRSRFRRHLDRFGHTVYNLDFANAVPADDPAPLIDTLRFYLRGEGTDPNQRQAGVGGPPRAGHPRPCWPGWTRRGGRCSAGCCAGPRASPRSARTRSGDIGLAWPQLRRMLLELGRRLVGAGVVDRPEDVFWLRRDELLAAPADRTRGRGPRRETVARPTPGDAAAAAARAAAGTGCSRA